MLEFVHGALAMALSLVLLAGCDSSSDCKDQLHYSGPRPEHDGECKGNSGCTTKYPTTCGCFCALCAGERCMGVICDDSCPPPACPVSKPDEGAGCNRTSFARWNCNYPAPCSCGSATTWTCECASTSWSCSLTPSCGCDASMKDGKAADGKAGDGKLSDIKAGSDGKVSDGKPGQ